MRDDPQCLTLARKSLLPVSTAEAESGRASSFFCDSCLFNVKNFSQPLVHVTHSASKLLAGTDPPPLLLTTTSHLGIVAIAGEENFARKKSLKNFLYCQKFQTVSSIPGGTP